MLTITDLNLVREALEVRPIVSQYECVLMPGEPVVHLELEQSEFIKFEV